MTDITILDIAILCSVSKRVSVKILRYREYCNIHWNIAILEVCLNALLYIYTKMYAELLFTTHCAHPSLIGPLELADMMAHISQSVSTSEYYPYGNINEHYQPL